MARNFLVFLCLPLAGCTLARESTVRDAERNLANAVEKTHESLSNQHVQQGTGDVSAIEADLAATRTELQGVVRRAEEKYQEAELTRQNLSNLGEVALVVTDLATGGRVRPLVDALSSRLDDTNRSVSTIDSRVTDTRTEVSEVKSGVARHEAKISEVEGSVAKLERAMSQLDESTKEKLASASKDLGALVQAKDDRERFATELKAYLENAGLTREQLAAFQKATEGLSTEEIIALLAAAGVGIGGGAGASRLGKSRSKEEIERLTKEKDELWDKVSSLERRVPGPSVQG